MLRRYRFEHISTRCYTRRGHRVSAPTCHARCKLCKRPDAPSAWFVLKSFAELGFVWQVVEDTSTAQVDPARTYEPFDGNTIAVGGKRLCEEVLLHPGSSGEGDVRQYRVQGYGRVPFLSRATWKATFTSARKCTPMWYCQTARACSKRFVSVSSMYSGRNGRVVYCISLDSDALHKSTSHVDSRGPNGHCWRERRVHDEGTDGGGSIHDEIKV